MSTTLDKLSGTFWCSLIVGAASTLALMSGGKMVGSAHPSFLRIPVERLQHPIIGER